MLLHLLGTTRLRTAAYRPQTNGLVERFHHQLKAALTAHDCPTQWVQRLPLTLLGIRTAFKTDLTCSSAELVFGTQLRLPTDLFEVPSQASSASDYVKSLRLIFADLRPQPTRERKPRGHCLLPDIEQATYVFLRYVPVRRPLQPHYVGPFPVAERQSSTYTIDVNGSNDPIALERLKPAYTQNANKPEWK